MKRALAPTLQAPTRGTSKPTKAAIAWACALAFATVACLGGSSASPTLTPQPTLRPTATATVAPTATATPTVEFRFQSDVSTVYYDVSGSNADEVFASMEANGPRDSDGEEALGLAAWEWTFPAVSTQTGPAGCQIGSLTMTVPLVVTLPRHLNRESLTPDIMRRWDDLAAEIAEHEQTHVDIVLDGMKELEGDLRSLDGQPTCSALRAEIESLWSDQSDAIDIDQAAFHVDDGARLEALRGPLERQVEANQAQLLASEAEIDALDSSLAGTDASISALSAELEGIEAEIAQIEATYPDLVLPSDVFDRYESLTSTYNSTLGQYNATVDDYNATLDRRNALADQHDALIDSTNRIIEDINWIQ